MCAVQGRAMKNMHANDDNYDKYRQTFDDADDAITSAWREQLKNGRFMGDINKDMSRGLVYGYKK